MHGGLCFCLQGQKFAIGTELMKLTERTVIQEQGSKFKFTGYEVSTEDTGVPKPRH